MKRLRHAAQFFVHNPPPGAAKCQKNQSHAAIFRL
jgi:hypothetical protein